MGFEDFMIEDGYSDEASYFDHLMKIIWMITNKSLRMIITKTSLMTMMNVLKNNAC